MVTTRIIDSEPALVVEGERKNLVVSDLHIGFEHKFSSNKNTINNSSSINEIIENIKKIIKKENPDTLILLGDVKSSIQNITKSEWRDVPYFYATEKKYYKKSISPIIEKIKDSVAAKIVTLDGTIIGNESILNDLI